MDMSTTIAPKSDQLNADSLLAGPMTITITKVSANEGNPEQPINVFFAGDGGKPYRPGKSMRRVMVTVWGAETSRYVGRSMTLYRDPEVQFGGMKVGGLRISHMSHIERDVTMPLTASKAQRKPFTVKKMEATAPKTPEPSSEPAFDLPALQERARLAAQQGSATLEAWWRHKDRRDERAPLTPMLPELKQIAATADAKGAPTEPDPFTPEDDVRLDQDGDVDDGTGDVLDDREPG